MIKVESIWEPQKGPQTAFVACPVFEIFFGGARGGGKTEAVIGDWLLHSSTFGEGAIGIVVRRELTQLSELIARCKQLFLKLGAKYNEQKKEFAMPGGARLKFAYLERDSDAENYQGHSYTRIYVEEAPNFPSPDPINKLRATLRSATGVPCGMRLTGNPGGPGHLWVKARYIDPNPNGYEIFAEEEEVEVDGTIMLVKLERVFIPSKITDNKKLMQRDPAYIIRLKQSGSESLVKAWLKGDWSIIDGAYFSEWDEDKHVLGMKWIKRIPAKARKFRAMDWGSSKPFSIGWYAISDGTWGLPKNALFKYREWYGASGVNKGLKMTADLVAQGILLREKDDVIKYGVSDPAIFIRNGGPSIAETMHINGCKWLRGDNKRLPGWEQYRMRLAGEKGIPMLYIAECCEDTIRTIPILQHSLKNIDDLDTEGEDHALDEGRYAVMSRPWLPKVRISKENIHSKHLLDCTFDQIVDRLKHKRKQNEQN